MEFKPTNRNPLKPRLQAKSRSAFTMIELLVSLSVGMLLLTAGMSLYLFSLTSMTSMSNYAELNNQSRNASDFISRDVRCSTSVASASTNQLVLSAPDGTNVTYAFDASGGTLIRTKGGDGRKLLKGVSSLTFSLYQRPVSNATYNTFPTATAPTAKMVSFQWTCSRVVKGSQLNTESIYSGIINLRNQ
jgi:Tfp pilus assembly protein PilW